MSNHGVVSLLVVSLLLVSYATANYEIFTQRYSADPAPVVHNGRVWMTTSHDTATQPGYDMRDYNCLSSDDMVNWRDEGIAFSFDSITWADYAWAQQIVKAPRNDSFIMYYAAVKGKNPGVGVAISPSGPQGPYTDVLRGPIMPGDDPTVWIDRDDPSIIAVCSNSGGGPLCGYLEEDMVTWKEPPQMLASYDHSTWHWFEAPWIARFDGVYYLSFMLTNRDLPSNMTVQTCPWTHNGFDIGYAMSKQALPLDNYTWMGSLQWNPPFDGGGPDAAGKDTNNHQGMVEFPELSGQYFYAYHNRKLALDRLGSATGPHRSIAIDRLYINQTDRSILPVTSTPSWMKPVKYLNPFVATPAFTMAGCSKNLGIENSTDPALPGTGQFNLARVNHLGWTRTRWVDFGSGKISSVRLRVATPIRGASVLITTAEPSNSSAEIRRTAIVECKVPITGPVDPHPGGWQIWTTVNCTLPSPLSLGVVPELYLVFLCDNCSEPQQITGVLNLHWWQFENESTRRSAVRDPEPTRVDVALVARGAQDSNEVLGPVVAACPRSTTVTILQASATLDEVEDCSATRFQLLDNEDGSWSIGNTEGDKDTQLACVDGKTGILSMTSAASSPDCTRFRLQATADGSYALQSWLNFGWITTTRGGEIFADASSANRAGYPLGIPRDAGRYNIIELSSKNLSDCESVCRTLPPAPPPPPPPANAIKWSWDMAHFGGTCTTANSSGTTLLQVGASPKIVTQCVEGPPHTGCSPRLSCALSKAGDKLTLVSHYRSDGPSPCGVYNYIGPNVTSGCSVATEKQLSAGQCCFENDS